jgi:hypothetical protein
MATKPPSDNAGPVGDVQPDPDQPQFGSLIKHRPAATDIAGAGEAPPPGEVKPDKNQPEFGDLEEKKQAGNAGEKGAGQKVADDAVKAKKHTG